MILELSGVREVAVVGHADEILGEKIVAFPVLEEDCDLSTKDVIRYCRQNLPAFKVPHEVVFQRELPKTPTGKIQKMELQNLLRVN